MATEAPALDLRKIPLVIPEWMVEAGFLGFLLIVFVGRSPFSPPAGTSLVGVNPTGAGDALRQLLYVAALIPIVLGSLQKRSLGAVRVIPPMLALLILWCLVSSIWADAHEISLRRAILQTILVLCAMLGVDAVGPDRSLTLWRGTLGAILLVNIASIPFIPMAVHQPGEIDPSLVGDWRGLFEHKNIAGSISAITATLFLFSAVERKRLVDFAMCALAFFFLVMTRSKSSLGLLPVSLLAGGLYCLSWRREIDRFIALLAAIFVVGAIGLWIGLDWSLVSRVLEDPSGFTGRTEIWQAELAYIHDHPILGSGFGTFTDTGGPSPLSPYVSGDWVKAVSHGHSGYLQMLFMLGGVGIVLSFFAFIAVPVMQFWRMDPARRLFKAMLFAIFVFLVLHNFLESDFFQDDGAPSVAVVIMMAMLSSLERERRERMTPP
jgi:exopolysaccharide production protein ExoQ